MGFAAPQLRIAVIRARRGPVAVYYGLSPIVGIVDDPLQIEVFAHDFPLQYVSNFADY
ncbi:MAG: hypothetical protein V3T62_06800 [Alphaproteobacteria bacterium]